MTNTQLFSRLLALFLVATTLVACDPENIDDTSFTPVFDCPDIDANIGDDCMTAAGVVGTVNADCECQLPTSYDCPDTNANIGDECETPGGDTGTINADCECELSTGYDCPDINANIGDECETPAGGTGTINADCEC